MSRCWIIYLEKGSYNDTLAYGPDNSGSRECSWDPGLWLWSHSLRSHLSVTWKMNSWWSANDPWMRTHQYAISGQFLRQSGRRKMVLSHHLVTEGWTLNLYCWDPQAVVGGERNRQFWLNQWPHIPGVDGCDLPIHSDVIREQRQADKALSINYLQKMVMFQKPLHFLTKHARNWRVIMVRLQMNLVWRGSFH